MPPPGTAFAILTPAEIVDLQAQAYVAGFSQATELFRPALDRLDSLDVRDVLNVKQAAALVGKKPKTIRAWIAAGLPAHIPEHTRGYNIRREDLIAWRTRHPEPEPA